TKNKLTLQAIKFRNTLSKTDFTKHQKYEKEWYDVSIKAITLSSKNTLHWSKGGYIHINKICIDDPSMLVYKDKRLKNPPFIEKKLPSFAIRHIPFPILVDTIEIHNGTVKYQEIVETGKTPGEVSFTRLHLQAYHLTNIKSLLKKNDLLN